MPDPMKLDTPGAISGADISSATDGAGVLFYSYQMARSGQPPLQVVRRRLANGTFDPNPVPLPMTVTGRGQLSVDGGVLYLTAWQESGIKTGWRIPVPGWVAAAPAAGGGLTAAERALLGLLGKVIAVIRNPAG